MVTAYFASSITDLSHIIKTQSNLFVPILADLTVYTIFERKVHNFRVGQTAGALAGTAAYCLLVHRTSLSVNLVGAVLYIAYKITYFVHEYLKNKPFEEIDREIPLTKEETLQDRFNEFKQHLQIVPIKAVYPSSDPDTLALQLKTFARDKWEDPDLLQEAENLMYDAYGIIIYKLQEAENEAEKNPDPIVLNQAIAQNLGEIFTTALKVFCMTYCHVRSMAYYIPSPDSPNADSNGNLAVSALPTESEDMSDPFDGEVSSPHIRMMELYKGVYQSLRPLWPHLNEEITTRFKFDVDDPAPQEELPVTSDAD